MEMLWQSAAGRLRAWFHCTGGGRLDTEDLLQECSLRAWRSWDQFNGTGSRTAWLFGIARHLLIDRMRRRRPVLVDDRMLAQRTASPDESDDNQQKLEEVWQMISRLPPEQKAVLNMRYAAGLSYAEIAQTLDVPVGTVRSRLHRALKFLREECENEND